MRVWKSGWAGPRTALERPRVHDLLALLPARDSLAVGLVDHMHLVQVPTLLGVGVRLWDGREALDESYDIETVASPNGVTQLRFT